MGATWKCVGSETGLRMRSVMTMRWEIEVCAYKGFTDRSMGSAWVFGFMCVRVCNRGSRGYEIRVEKCQKSGHPYIFGFFRGFWWVIGAYKAGKGQNVVKKGGVKK